MDDNRVFLQAHEIPIVADIAVRAAEIVEEEEVGEL